MKILHCEQPVVAGEVPQMALLTDSSLSRNRWPLFLPPHSEEWVMTFGIGVRIMRLGKFIAARFAPRYYDAVTLVARLRPAGAPVPASACLTAFDSAAVVGEWCAPAPELDIEGTFAARIAPDPARLNTTVEQLSRYFTLKTGDIIVAGDIENTIIPSIGGKVELTLNGAPCLNFKIR